MEFQLCSLLTRYLFNLLCTKHLICSIYLTLSYLANAYNVTLKAGGIKCKDYILYSTLSSVW